MKQTRVLGGLLGLFFVYSAFLHAQTAPSTYSAYTGTDAKIIPPAPALGPANSLIQDPTFGSWILRVTDTNTNGGESFVSTDAGSHRAWNADSTAIKLTGPHGDSYWMEFSPGAFKVGDGSNNPVPHPLTFPAGWEWSTVDPNIIYFLNGNQIAKYNKATGVRTNLGGPPNGDPVVYSAVVIGRDNWVCAAAGPGVQDSYTEIYCLNPISPGTTEFIDVYNKKINGVLQSDPNWPTSAAGQVIGIHGISGGTGANWLEVTFHQQSWAANGGAVLNLGTNSWSELTNGDYYWSGHVSMGNGKYANSAGSINGRDSRGIVLRNPDNLMDSSQYLFISQPPNTNNGWCDADHTSWLNSMTNPNAPILDSRYMATAPNCAFAWTGEIYAAAVDGSNTVWRFAHNHDGGCYYGEGFAQISNDGNWALFSSYWDGTLGADTSFGCGTRIDTFIVQLSGGSPNPIPPAASLKASYLGVTGQDYVGPQNQLTGDGVPDWHIQLQGLRGTPVKVQITSTAGGVWQTPYNGYWVILAQYGASGSGDLWFEPSSTPGFHVKVWYSDSTTDEADATATATQPPVTSTLKASYLGATGQDYVGPYSQLTPDGVPDWHIQLQGLRGTPVKVQITSTAGGVWQTPYNGYWVILAQYGASGSGDLWFEPSSTPGFHVKVWYSDSTTDEVDATAPQPPVTGALKASYLGATGQDYVGQQGQLTPNGIPDWHIQLQGLRGTPVKVQITSTTGGVWQTPYNGFNWVILAQYGASGSGDLWFESWSTPGFHVKVWYSDSTTDEVDATATATKPPVTSTLKASYLGATGQDYVGQQAQLTPDGVPDWHIQLQGLRGTPVTVQITSTTGGVWQMPYNGFNWVILAQYGASGNGDLWFEPWSTPGFHVKVWYSDSTTDEADAS